MKKKIQQTKNISGSDFLQNMIFLPIVILLVVVPFILRWIINPLSPDIKRYWPAGIDANLFCQAKGNVIIILAIIMLLILFFTTTKKNIDELKKDKILLIAISAFLIITILSVFTSINKDIAIFGAPERREGLFLHLSYIIILIYLYTKFKSSEDFKYIKLSILVLSGVMVIIGFTQILGSDILQSEFVKNLVIPNEYKDSVTQTPVEGYVYLTLMHSNYVGSYCSMIIPFLAMIAISTKESRLYRVIAGILTILTAYILVKAQSQAGIVGTGVALLILIIINFKNIFKDKKILIWTLVFFVAVAGIANIATKGLLVNNTIDILQDAKQIFVKDKDYKYDPTYGMGIYDVKAKWDNVKISTKFGEINLVFKYGKIEFFDKNNAPIPFEYIIEENRYDLSAPFNEITFLDSNNSNSEYIKLAFFHEKDKYFLIDWNKQDGASLIDSQGNKYELIVAPHIGFEGSEKAGSMRGYIWSRTLPLVMKKPILGYGPDNFLMAFPHYDVVAKTYAYDTPFMIVDKPHNLYLLYTINSGIFALMALLVIWGKYIIDSLKLYALKKEYSETDYYAIACFTAVMGYLAAGFFNDSVPTVAPIFWVLLGTGYALNKLNKKKSQN